ncbi:unnamed protein product [Peniophora sp. CBMAI 1063]|nr:unnamed protein product [Peniophora sp. CBMAI 1063]
MLVLIFTFVVRKHFEDKDGAEPPALRLRGVCRQWRDTVNAAQGLWKIVPLQNVVIAQEFLSRCRNVPLRVNLRGHLDAVHTAARREALDLVLQRPQQIGTLSLIEVERNDPVYGRAFDHLRSGAFSGLRALEVLRSNGRLRDDIFPGPIPQHLNTLRFDLNGEGLLHLHRALTLCPLTVLELRQLDINAFAFSALMDALSRLPHLEELIMDVVGSREGVLPPRQADRSIVLAHLRIVECSAELPYLPLLLRAINISPAAKIILSCHNRSPSTRPIHEMDFQDLTTLRPILHAHFSVMPRDFRFTELAVECKFDHNFTIVGELALNGPQASDGHDLPKRFIFQYRLRYTKDEDTVDRSRAIFPLLLDSVPIVGRVTQFSVKNSCMLTSQRFTDIFAAAPTIDTIVVDNIYAKHMFRSLRSTYRLALLPNLRKLVLYKIRLNERISYATGEKNDLDVKALSLLPYGWHTTVGDLLLLCLTCHGGRGCENWNVFLRKCSLLDDTLKVLGKHLPSRLFWDGEGNCPTPKLP